METIEMDLMQAQIGELTTEVSSVSGRVKKLEDNGGGGNATIPEASYYIFGAVTAGIKLNNVNDYENITCFKITVNGETSMYVFVNGSVLMENCDMSSEFNAPFKYNDDGTTTLVTGTKNVIILSAYSISYSSPPTITNASAILAEYDGDESGYLIDTDTGEFYYVPSE